MKVEIEVVGERCRRKGEPRQPSRQDCTDRSVSPLSFHAIDRTPCPRGGPAFGKDRRRVATSMSACPTPLSWRQMRYLRHDGRGVSNSVSHAQAGVKVRISYVDGQGRVKVAPRSASTGRRVATLTPHRERNGTDRFSGPGSASAGWLGGWDSQHPAPGTGDRHQWDRVDLPAGYRTFSCLLERRRPHLAAHLDGLVHLDDDTEDDMDLTSSSSFTMPAIHTPHPELSAPSHHLHQPASSSTTVASTTTTSFLPMQPHIKELKATRRDQDTHGTAESSAPPQPGARGHSSQPGSRLWPRTADSLDTHVRSAGNVRRAVTTSPGKRGQQTVSDTVRDCLRSAVTLRRSKSASWRRWQESEGGESAAPSRARYRLRRRTTMQHPLEVARDDCVPTGVSKMYRKFRMVGVITITLIRLKAAIVVNSLDRTERSAAEIQWRTLYGQQEAEKLAFNKSHFSRERISTKMPRWALRILEVAPEQRTEQDCRRLHALLRGMRSFDKFTEQIQLNLCRAFSYICVGESRIVLRRGHIGHNFYFVYSGSVFVNVQDIDGDGQPFIKTEAILARGDSFGELALLKDIRRTATVSVRETCELLVVDKDVFSQVCPKIFENELMEKKKFISRLPLFSTKWWSPDSLSSLCMEAQIQEYKINKIVVENNTVENWLYICMEGKCQVIRCLSEGGREEPTSPCPDPEQSLVLSEEIIELLSSASKTHNEREAEMESESSKEKLLSSLGLEYVHTGKRSGAFLEEVEAEERRKALMASSAPMTLTSLMAHKREEGKSDLVYINVGSLESDDVFDMGRLFQTPTQQTHSAFVLDMGSLVQTPAQRTHSALLLVSSGARMLRVKKSLFFRLASPQALEHTRTLVSKHPFPSEAAILESYKRKRQWNSYKSKVVQEVVSSRDMRTAPLCRARLAKRKEKGEGDETTTRRQAGSGTHTPCSVQNGGSACDSSTGQVESGAGADDTGSDSDKLTNPGDGTPEDTAGQVWGDSKGDTGGDLGEDKRAAVGGDTGADRGPPGGSAIFPVVEVDTVTYPETPRSPTPSQSGHGADPSTTATDSTVTPVDVPPRTEDSQQRDAGPGPEAVIIRRKSSLGSRPSVKADTTFITRRRRSRDDTSSGALTRFNLASDLDAATVAEVKA